MRLSKYQKNILRAEKRKNDLKGKGLIVYENNTRGELNLSRPTSSGKVKVGVREQFQGDDYYMFMVKNVELKIIRIIESPSVQTEDEELLTENTENQMEEKLITEQPPVVTNEGTVEFVTNTKPKQQKLNENQPQQNVPQVDILLNENPLDGIDLI